MNKLATQRQSRTLLPELSELLNGFPTFAGFPAIAGLRPFFDNHPMRLEDETREGLYQVRAELPGVGSFDRTVSLPAGADEDDFEDDESAERKEQEQPVG
ncbi:MAG: hypothetical protein QOD39_1238 [Mycobacterium sp.]|nr:hypothetical protein [Mycobacterium sp.]